MSFDSIASLTPTTKTKETFLSFLAGEDPLKNALDNYLILRTDHTAAITDLYKTVPANDRYAFLALITKYHGTLGYGPLSDNPKDMSHLPNALAAFKQTDAAMETKTKWQSRGMMLGGVTFGMEVVMIGLERVAWSDAIENPEVILALITAGFMIFGYPMGRFFKSAHHDALLKQNKESYFEAQYGQSKEQHSLVLFSDRLRNRPGYAIAAFGVLAEGLLIFRGILSGIGFTADLLTLCVTGDDYENKIPGTYFMETCPEAGYVLCPLATLFAAAVSYCLMSGHFALDGRECCEYEEAQKTSSKATFK